MPTAVPLSQMVDLALGTPELGAVNFNVLHTLLHAMIAKLNIQDVKAEINDHDRELLQGNSKSRVGSAPQIDKDSTRGDDSLLDESISEVSCIPNTAVPYHRLEHRVAELAKQLEDLNALPTTQELMEKVQKATEKPVLPVTEMWQGIQLKKRVDANEDGVAKLMLMMEDLLKEFGVMKNANDEMKKQLDGHDLSDLNKRLQALENLARDLQNQLDGFMKEVSDKLSRYPAPEDFDSFVRWNQLEEALLGIQTAIEDVASKATPPRTVIDMSMQTEPRSRPTSARSQRSSSSSGGPSAELLEVLEKLGHIATDHLALERRVEILEEEIKNKLDKNALENLNLSEDILNQLNLLKGDVNALQAAVAKLNELSGGDEELKAQLAELLKKVKEDSDALRRLQQLILQLQAEIEKINNTVKALTEKSKLFDDLFALCDELEKRKADKEYVAMEVDVKADKHQLEGKVNHSLFDSTTSEINKTIKDILDKLAGSDSEWKSLLAKLANDLDGKLDRLELNPLKEWLEAKLKALSKKIREGQLQWGDDEAAGLRRQLIQRFHCLSCDKPVDVIPKAPQPSIPAGYALPATHSPRPYTTFELDQIRQHARSYGPPDVVDFYASTRQCGGSHTLTYPHKRLTRTNNHNHLFREDDAEPVQMYKDEMDVLGADGHIYKGRMEMTRLEAKIPLLLANQQNNAVKVHSPCSSPGHQRPMSARGAPKGRATTPTQPNRPATQQGGPRPHSARLSSSLPDQGSGNTTPLPSEDRPEAVKEEGEIIVEVPSQVPKTDGK